jgi:hypothetical protein
MVDNPPAPIQSREVPIRPVVVLFYLAYCCYSFLYALAEYVTLVVKEVSTIGSVSEFLLGFAPIVILLASGIALWRMSRWAVVILLVNLAFAATYMMAPQAWTVRENVFFLLVASGVFIYSLVLFVTGRLGRKTHANI